MTAVLQTLQKGQPRKQRWWGGPACQVAFWLYQGSDDDNRVERLWVRIMRKVNKVDIMVGVCYRPPIRMERQSIL